MAAVKRKVQENATVSPMLLMPTGTVHSLFELAQEQIPLNSPISCSSVESTPFGTSRPFSAQPRRGNRFRSKLDHGIESRMGSVC